MNTLRNGLKSKYSQIPNELVTDLTLCAGSLRVLLYLFTKPDDWNVYNLDICKQLNISEKTLTRYWKILLNSKWLRREQKRNEKGVLTGGYIYHIGNFTISDKSSESDKSYDYNNNKPIHKEETNTNKKKPLSSFDLFMQQLKEKATIKSKVTNTKETKKLFDKIEDKEQLLKDYLEHQEQKGEYAKRITPYLLDYESLYKSKSSLDEWR